MNALIEKFLERPLSHKIAIWVGTLLVFSFIFWQYFYSSKHSAVVKLEEKIENLTTQISHEQRLAKSLGKFREEVKELDVKLKSALQELPDKREIPDLLNSVSNLARDAGLEVNLFKPEADVIKEFYAEVPVAISVAGTFHQVATFFDEVGKLSRIVNINQILVREPKVNENDAHVAIKSDCMATTFRYLDDSERIKPNTKSDDKKRKKKGSSPKKTNE